MSPLVKHLLKRRQALLRKGGQKQNPNVTILQERINKLIRENQLQAVKHDSNKHDKGTRSWWSTINSITGRKSICQSISSIIDPASINEYFGEINTDPDYSLPEMLNIPEGTRVPTFTVHEVTQALINIKRTTSGPDDFPYWLFRDFGYHLAPVITDVFNASLLQHTVPLLWKEANIRPVPKELPFTSCNQLRPISLTNIIMRLFERLVYKNELSTVCANHIDLDQFAYRKGHNSTMALLKSQHNWLKWLDGNADFVRIFSFDFSKAFDSVSHRILVSKLRDVDINPYILNWLISFISNRKQQVVVDNIITEYIDITRGVPQGTVLGPILFSLMINDIKPVSPSSLLVKFADDITVSIPVRAEDSNIAESEVNSIMEWAEKNQMTLNLNKTWEMLLKSSSLKVPPAPLAIVERKTKLKLLGVTFEADPVNWDTHIDHVLSKASSRLYILRVCRFYGYPKEQLDLLFQSLIISVFTYAIEVWGCCYYDKYLKRIDKLFARAFKSGYCLKKYSICDILTTRDSKLWNKITSNTTALDDLLPPRRTRHLRSRGHDYILPRVRTSRFKSTFVNRCLFSIVCH